MLLMLKESDNQGPYNLTLRGFDVQSPNNWHHLWEANKNSRRRATEVATKKTWLRRKKLFRVEAQVATPI